MSTNADKISKILEDPESLKMISEIAQSFLDGNISDSDNTKTESYEVTSEQAVSIPEIISSNDGIAKLFSVSDIENTIRLITALKPYMNKNRQNNADYILKMLNLLKFASKSNISELGSLLGLFR